MRMTAYLILVDWVVTHVMSLGCLDTFLWEFGLPHGQLFHKGFMDSLWC